MYICVCMCIISFTVCTIDSYTFFPRLPLFSFLFLTNMFETNFIVKLALFLSVLFVLTCSFLLEYQFRKECLCACNMCSVRYTQ